MFVLGSGDLEREAHRARGREKPRGIWPEESSSCELGCSKTWGLLWREAGQTGVIRGARQAGHICADADTGQRTHRLILFGRGGEKAEWGKPGVLGQE